MFCSTKTKFHWTRFEPTMIDAMPEHLESGTLYHHCFENDMMKIIHYSSFSLKINLPGQLMNHDINIIPYSKLLTYLLFIQNNKICESYLCCTVKFNHWLVCSLPPSSWSSRSRREEIFLQVGFTHAINENGKMK